MLRSMYSGISGLKNFQTKLDVIGNNISNVNTYGFKKGRVVFKDLISQTTAGASASTETRGGVNPKQVGLGSQIAAIDTIHSTGSLQTTARTLDLAISGDGFFQVADSTEGKAGFTNTQYTRAGNFYMDRDGYVVNSDGKYLVGYDATLTSATVPIMGLTTETLTFNNQSFTLLVNEDGEYVTDGATINPDDVDEAADLDGALVIVDGKLQSYDDADGFTQIQADYEDENGDAQLVDIEIDSSTGKLFVTIDNARYEVTGENTLVDEDGNVVDFTADDSPITSFTADIFDTIEETLIQTGTGTVYTTTLTEALRPIQIPTTAQSMSIAQDGTINFVDENGKLQVAGQIQLAKFPNTGGLEKAGSNYYKETSNSGQPVVGTATENGIGSIEAGFLEMSNVDLSEEFTEMIVTQRGFQANSRIITTSDEILQELVNLKR
ncbi:hypothetical protein CD30_01735 [Ureibacillus massiliensis 4400831 = CIP 108448 = CCUG 49529]|uniref:Flagellar hook protein FlgE n=1 Tax=Ureibacillus massiliensis 4400831 = CIP 108448 = CCUG 49529 TaxID=1211035 RepID=A0A0A3J8F9_9BACL|nr:flagellar hook-basal body complex protein [Ureibacillus massiliensis]KGR92070.1 hypothetical protein CD30_01735 [Ureibacillus massiliensis 4400831 = CIP 108448 = CCUG 49529]